MVSSVKGTGNDEREKDRHNSRVYEGMLNSYADPGVAELKAGAREVAAAGRPRFEAAGGVADLSKLGIKHVFLIIKENRTYDQVFGDIPKGRRDPSLVMYGRDVTPNHHALAEEFVLLDNFYASGAISFEGHQSRGARAERRAARLCLEHGRLAHRFARRLFLAGQTETARRASAGGGVAARAARRSHWPRQGHQ
jgi:hypothetical protein